MTGLQWAVLAAYARSLPPGAERDRARAFAERGRPGRCGPALVLAASMGFTHNGSITLKGADAARRFLAQQGTV